MQNFEERKKKALKEFAREAIYEAILVVIKEAEETEERSFYLMFAIIAER